MTYDLNITFDDNLVTGNKTIDTQHKELIDRIQNFVIACQNGDSKVKAIKLLDYLNEYTDFHFKEEEALQEKAGYPEREKHYEKHEEFKKTIQELYEYLQEYVLMCPNSQSITFFCTSSLNRSVGPSYS